MEPRMFAGKYTVERELGVARGGRTLLAVDADGTRVIVKVVHPVSPAAAAAVESDVALISGIRHPSLPLVHEWGHDGSDFYVVREYVPGADLELELGQQGSFAPASAARYGIAAADALAQIHARGLIHGNVKAANLIRTPEDEIELVGNSLGLAEPGVASDAPAASAAYLAPEQVDGGPLTPATDVYAMGAVLYELVAGRPPFGGASASAVADQQVHAVPEPLADKVPDLPAALESVIMKCLEKSPAARYPDGAALKAALVAATTSAPVTAPSARRGDRRAPAKRSMWPWIAAALLVVAAGFGIAWGMGAFASHEATVPALVGMTQADAVSALTGAGLQVGSVTYANKPVSGVPDGSVSSQSLAQGSKVDPSTKVDLVLAGSQTVKVPNVVGLTETQATLTLQSAGLAAGTITSVATSTVSPGMVLVQAPAAGADVSHGTAVNLQVSQGSVPVPNVVGVAQSDAEASLKTAGFTVSVTPQGSTSVASGRVISQNPSAGVTAQPGSTVTIVVSTGSDLVVVPNVVTMTQANAVNALTAAGFKSTVTLHTGGGPVGTVISQVPLAGAKAASGSTVAITVAQ